MCVCVCVCQTLQEVLPALGLCAFYSASSDHGIVVNFLLAARPPLKICPSCSSALYKNTLIYHAESDFQKKAL